MNARALPPDMTPEEQAAWQRENPDLVELTLFLDGELPPSRRAAFLRRLSASPELREAMEAHLAIGLAATHAGPQPVTDSVPRQAPAESAPARILPFRGALLVGFAGLPAAAAALFVVGLWGRGPLEVDVVPKVEQMRGAVAMAGDAVVIRSPAWPGASRALRIYDREGPLVFECPNAASCRDEVFATEAVWTPAEPGTYRVVFVQSLTKPIPASKGTLLSDVESFEGLEDKTTTLRVSAAP